MEKFQNLMPLDFTIQENYNKQIEALDKIKPLFGKEYPNIIGGKEYKTVKKTVSINPANTTEVVATFQKSGVEHSEIAMQAALTTFETWSRTTPEYRAEFLFKAAEIIRQRRFEINAWMISEVGKNFAEADGDTCEAVDFLEFYGREALRYAQKQELTRMAGEDNNYFYIPLGVGIVIPPWNFPFAILVGMTAASIVSGNTVVLKPSSESPMMGWLFNEIMREIELPDGVINFLVASGAEAGDYLVDHAKTRYVSFTGSMEVGIRIYERASKVNPGQIWLKRVVAEMGGKDAILVDNELHSLEDAVDGVLAAAFGFQGQKCSACSRAIIHTDVYDDFLEILKTKIGKFTVGLPSSNAPMGPVVSEKAYKSILNYIEIGKSEGRLIAGGDVAKVDGVDGYYIQPTVIADLAPKSRLAQEEVFGPVLAITKCDSFEDGINIFNGTIYGLTGSLYTSNKEKLERGARELHCGNLYLNRKSTGAYVDVHPFGGFNMSGTDSKAGSRDYLLLFMQGKTVTEKIIG